MFIDFSFDAEGRIAYHFPIIIIIMIRIITRYIWIMITFFSVFVFVFQNLSFFFVQFCFPGLIQCNVNLIQFFFISFFHYRLIYPVVVQELKLVQFIHKVIF